MSDQLPQNPDGPAGGGIPTLPGLAHDERARLDDLTDRFRKTSYPRMLGLDWSPTPPEVERRVRLLEDWLKEIKGRPGLTADDRSSVVFCEGELEQARWILKHPVLGPAYLKASRARAEIIEARKPTKE